MLRYLFVLATSIAVAGCAQQSSKNNASGSIPVSSQQSVLSVLRAKADPNELNKIREEEASQRAKQIEVSNSSQAGTSVQTETSAIASVPAVSQAPFAPPAEQVASSNANANQAPAGGGLPFWPFNQNNNQPQNNQQTIASYGGYGGGSVPPPPPGMANGLVPPPPAVSLSTQAQALPSSYGMPVDPNNNPYANYYAQQAIAPMRPSLFGSGQRSSSADSPDDADGSSARNKKMSSFVLITPTGMESRSPYKQRDDLKLLWKGALATSSLQEFINKDGKLAQQITKIDVDLPGETSKGSFSVSQRQIDAVFKPVALDKKIVLPVRKMQTSVVQSYYRYLYAYNKYAMALQTVAARKQEVDVAGSMSEQQRAAADLSQSQIDADSAKDDMKSAQGELASIAGAQAARVLIGRVSGVSPNADSLVQADAQNSSQAGSANSGFWGSIFKAGKSQAKSDNVPVVKATKIDAGQSKTKKAAATNKIAEQKSMPTQTKQAQAKNKDQTPDLNSVGAQVAVAPKPAATVAVAPASPIVFQLKNVSVTPRKSILSVSIRNTGANSFSFNPDVVTISEGNRKLSDATVRTEFDVTTVAPNQEITGTITIFGRPWNDRLSVCILDNANHIQMRR